MDFQMFLLRDFLNSLHKYFPMFYDGIYREVGAACTSLRESGYDPTAPRGTFESPLNYYI
jgi:hypothetical protein